MAIKKQTFMKGILVIMVSQVLIKVLGFIYRIVLTNFQQFADAGNSYYGSGYTVYTFILAIATMGIPNTISKLISEKIAIGDKRGAHKIFRTALYLFSTIGVIFALLLFFGSSFIANNIIHNPGVEYTLMALSPAIIFVAMSAVLRGYFVGMQNMMEYSKAQILEQVVNSVLSITFVAMLLNSTPQIMAAGSTLATTVATATAFMYLLFYYNKNKKDIWEDIKKSDRFSIDSRKKIIKKLISYVIPISFGSVVVALSGMIDVVTVMSGLEKFGYSLQVANEKFGIILGKVDILIAVPLSINVAFAVALVPFISSAIAQGKKEEATRKINLSLKISSLIALPCAVGLVLLADPIFKLIFPNASDGAYLLQIQAWALIFSVVAQTMYGALQGLGKLYVPGLCLLFGVIIKYIINVIFIPIYGEIVPPISTVVFQVIAFSLAFTMLFRYLKSKPKYFDLFIKPIMATVVMAISVLVTFNLMQYFKISLTISTIVTIIIAVLVYIISIFIFKILSKEEVNQLPFGDKINDFAGKFIKK